MYYIVESDKTFEQACQGLGIAARKRGFDVLHVHDLGDMLRVEGKDFPEGCRVFEICETAEVLKVLRADMRLNMAMPCRLSVYTHLGKTFIGMIKPSGMMGFLSEDQALREVVRGMEAQTMKMIDEAAEAG